MKVRVTAWGSPSLRIGRQPDQRKIDGGSVRHNGDQLLHLLPLGTQQGSELVVDLHSAPTALGLGQLIRDAHLGLL